MKKLIVTICMALTLIAFLLPEQTAFAKAAEDYTVTVSSVNDDNAVTNPENYPVLNVTNGAFTVHCISTCHDGGEAGTITLMLNNKERTEIGSWQATARIENGFTYWDIFPDIVLQPGAYIIKASRIDNWCWNGKSNDAGFVEVRSTAIITNTVQEEAEQTQNNSTDDQINSDTASGFDCASWAFEEIKAADSMGILPDVLKSSDLKQNITREEFASVCVAVYEYMVGTTLPDPTEDPFLDTDNSDVLKAYEIGITNGTDSTHFSPYGVLSREQAATMLTRVYTKLNESNSNAVVMSAGAAEPFADDASIAGYAKESVYFMAANEIINGVGNNSFAPKNTAGRQVAVIIAMRMANKLQ